MRRSHLLAVLALLPIEAAHAGGSGTEDVACGSVGNRSNIPNGAVFLSRGDGPVKAVLDAVGEYRTHSGISHGNGWYTHSTMFSPGTTGWPTYCSTPAEPSELQNGYPGSTQINDGALYRFYYQPDHAGPEAFYYQRTPASNAGVNIGNWLWTSSTYAWVSSRQDASQGFYRVGFTNVTPYAQYSLYQYRDMQGINNGGVPWNYGDVCSTTLAYGQQQSQNGAINNNRGDGVNTYAHWRVVNGLNSLYNSVENQCANGTGFFEDLGAAITCFEGICDDAARQVTNCFADGANGHCYNDSDRWQQIRDWTNQSGPKDGNGYSTAVSISPDNVGGWSGWGYGSAAPYAAWSWDGNNTVYWNGAGSTYGCWF